MKSLYIVLPLFLLGLSACIRVAPPPPQQQVYDPYAVQGSDAIYQGLPGTGSLAGEATAEYFRSGIGDTVLFAANQTNLSPEARLVLVRQAEWLNKNSNFTAVVQGHAEETGTREYNLALGARRASAVEEYLIAQGVSPDRIRTLSFGKERPAEICSDEICYAKNRRAVTVVTSTGVGS